MATHSSILAWRIPWAEEPGRLQSTGHKELDVTDPHSIPEAQRSPGSLLVSSRLQCCLTTELNLSFRISHSELFPLTRKTYKFKDTLNRRGGSPEWMVNYDKWHSIKIPEQCNT